MMIQFKDKTYVCKKWDGECLIGICALDTETTLILPGQVPQVILTSVFDGTTCYFIQNQNLKDFFKINSEITFCFVNAAFDLLVLEKAEALDSIEMLESNKVISIDLWSKLIGLAKTGSLGHGSLAKLSLHYLEVELFKDTKSAFGNDIRTSFDLFLNADGTVEYQKMPESYLQYAGLDAIVTWFCHNAIKSDFNNISTEKDVDPDQLFSLDLQQKASLALEKISKNGICTNQSKVFEYLTFLEKEKTNVVAQLSDLGWIPGVGSQLSLQKNLELLEKAFDFQLPRTPTGRLSSDATALQEYRYIPFIGVYLKYKELPNLISLLGKMNTPKIYGNFNPLNNTGRTACSNLNLQNFHRSSEIRSCIIPSTGHLFLDIDYSQIELRALAQITFEKYGYSKMLDLLNSGQDIHRFFAAEITGKSIGEVSDEDRRKAKACNFGFPGGLNVRSFLGYAKNSYGISLSFEEATILRDRWFCAFPEVQQYYNEIMGAEKKLVSSGIEEQYLQYVGRPVSGERAFSILKGILLGRTHMTNGYYYSYSQIEWAFGLFKHLCRYYDPVLSSDVEKRIGSQQVWNEFTKEFNSIIFPSGRCMSRLGKTQALNNAFQGRAADGAKLGLYNLIKENFRVVNFIHDEYLIEVPEDSNLLELKLQAEKILIDAMKKFCPDVKIEVDSKYLRSWDKYSEVKAPVSSPKDSTDMFLVL